jgi:hypothetical protein
MSIRAQRWLASVLLSSAASFGCVVLGGCERKETLVDVETPNGGVEVERNVDTGKVEVEAGDNN